MHSQPPRETARALECRVASPRPIFSISLKYTLRPSSIAMVGEDHRHRVGHARLPDRPAASARRGNSGRSFRSSVSTGFRGSSCSDHAFGGEPAPANFTSRLRKLSLPVNSRSLVIIGIGPLRRRPTPPWSRPPRRLFLLRRRRHRGRLGRLAIPPRDAGCTSSPTVISIVPSVPMMISPISGRDAVEVRQELVRADRRVSQLLPVADICRSTGCCRKHRGRP